MTTTYILVSALMYYFWWHKPYDARYVTVLFSPGSVSRSVECGPSGELPFQHDQPGFNAALNRHGQHFALNEQLTSGDGNPKRVKKGTFQYHDLLHLEKENVSMVLIYVCCLTLSASNGFLALPWAWSTFPSPSMQYAWNTASGFAMVFPASFPVFFVARAKYLQRISRGESGVLGKVVFYFLSLFYVVSRLIIIVIAMCYLRSMPLRVYEKFSWEDSLPTFA